MADGTVVTKVTADEPINLDAFDTKETRYVTEPDSPLVRLTDSFLWFEPAGSLVAKACPRQ